MNNLTNEQKMQTLSLKVDMLIKRGKVFTNQEVYTYIEWFYGKKRWWTDKYILPRLQWKLLKDQSYPYKPIGKYMNIDELKSKLRSILGDY